MVILKGLVAQKDFLHDFFDGLWRFLRNHHKPSKKSRKKSLKKNESKWGPKVAENLPFWAVLFGIDSYES